jgi:hypothetical protein
MEKIYTNRTNPIDPMNFNQMNQMNESQQEQSFRGYQIPQITDQTGFQVSDNRQVIEKIKNMPPEERQKVTIEAVHFEGWRVSHVKLTTGDIVSVETAIALAKNNMLNDYTTGATMHGKRTLRSKPSADGKGIYELPRF